ncbi:hypothetical protein U9M48_041526 [Paspalum notatum var. saurae]|uniref:DUF1618 domain-containing protein n=1 Tax=Paspalum notatum var. saurae TaxID=547442 RepID=A0AAQ3UT04_PASNO
MADSDAARLLRIPPPIHSNRCPGSFPGSILLDPYGYLSARTNGTTAEGSTKDGKRILVTFWAATPPRVSCFTVFCPDWKPFALGDLPAVLCSDDDLVLLHVPICREDHRLLADVDHYFVYQAGTKNKPPSLELIPTIPGPPHDISLSDSEVVLLRCHSQGDSFYFLAVLLRVFGCYPYNDDLFALHLYSSKTGKWSTRSPMRVDSPNKDFRYSYTSTVLAIGGELGSVGFVDLWRGILICDLLIDSHSLRYIPLPPPLVPKPPKGYPPYIRNIILLEGYIKFFEMRYLAGRRAARSNGTGCTCATTEGGWVAATKKMKISDIGSGNDWEDDCAFKFSEIPVDSPKHAQMLSNLKHATADTKLSLRRLHAGYPALSLHDSDVVYIMHISDPDNDKASLVAVDMRNKTIKDVADFGFGRPLGYTYTYLQSGISKHLSIWSSSW